MHKEYTEMSGYETTMQRVVDANARVLFDHEIDDEPCYAEGV